MPEPLVFLKTAWMELYAHDIDSLVGTHRYIRENDDAAEIYNFEPSGRYMFGYTHFKQRLQLGKHFDENVASTGAFVDRVTVIWIADPKDGRGVVVVGWYEHARLYAELQDDSNGLYLVRAKREDCKLIPAEERNFRIENGPRMSPIWYAENQAELVDKVRRLIADSSQDKPVVGRRAQPDAEKILAVEIAAVKAASRYFTERGYTVDSVERDKVGWDLEATRDKSTLKIEVKGTTGSEIRAELTPNEYDNAKKHRKTSYRICVVTNALDRPVVHVFEFSAKDARWRDQNDEFTLNFEELIGARLSV